MKKTLLLGTTPSRANPKRVKFPLSPEETFTGEVHTLDIGGEGSDTHSVFDLEGLHGTDQLPYADECFDEIHAYEILEHFGMQGDYKSFFREFGEYWRILKEKGLMVISCPMWDSPWSFGDPGHCRVLPKEIFAFLTEDHYEQIKKDDNSCSDYIALVNGWWTVIGVEESVHQLYVILQKA